MLSIKGVVDLEFKWSDNMQTDGDIDDFLVNGDVALYGRFNFHCVNRAHQRLKNSGKI